MQRDQLAELEALRRRVAELEMKQVVSEGKGVAAFDSDSDDDDDDAYHGSRKEAPAAKLKAPPRIYEDDPPTPEADLTPRPNIPLAGVTQTKQQSQQSSPHVPPKPAVRGKSRADSGAGSTLSSSRLHGHHSSSSSSSSTTTRKEVVVEDAEGHARNARGPGKHLGPSDRSNADSSCGLSTSPSLTASSLTSPPAAAVSSSTSHSAGTVTTGYSPTMQAAMALKHQNQSQQSNRLRGVERGGGALVVHCGGGGTANGIGRVVWTPENKQRRPKKNEEAHPTTTTPSSVTVPRQEGGDDGNEDDDDDSDWGDDDEGEDHFAAPFVENEKGSKARVQKKNTLGSSGGSKAGKSNERAVVEKTASQYSGKKDNGKHDNIVRTPPILSGIGVGVGGDRSGLPPAVDTGGDISNASERGQWLHSELLRHRNGNEHTAVAVHTPSSGGGGGDGEGSSGGGGDGRSSSNGNESVGSNVSPSTLSERTCIVKFGISYHEIITKLVMEEGVLSEAESRMVLLLLSEADNESPAVGASGSSASSASATATTRAAATLQDVRQRMLNAVVAVETKGINKQTVREFRSELSSVAFAVSKHQSLVTALQENRVHMRQSKEPTQTVPSPSLSSSPSAPLSPPLSPPPPTQGSGSSSSSSPFHTPASSGSTSGSGSSNRGRSTGTKEDTRATEAADGTPPPAPATALEVRLASATSGGAASSNFGSLAKRSPGACPGEGCFEISPEGRNLTNLLDYFKEGDEEGDNDDDGGNKDKPASSSSSLSFPPLAPRQQQPSASSSSSSPSLFSLPSLGVGSAGNQRQRLADLFQRIPALHQVMHKVLARISELPKAELLARKQVLLVASGAFNPIHKLHLRMLYIARKYLEERTDLQVLGGFVSPQHATEVRSRYRATKHEIIPPKHRLAMARRAVGDSTWLTVDPWEITRRRVMDYLSVLEHVDQVLEACFPGLGVKVVWLCNADALMQLSPEGLRSRGHGCLCVCRPQETDRLLLHMGVRWRQVAYVVEDAAILSRELEATTSTRVRQTLIDVAVQKGPGKLLISATNEEEGGGDGGGSSRQHGQRYSHSSLSSKGSDERSRLVQSMVGLPVARYMEAHSLGAKMSGSERWTVADKEFALFQGREMGDMGYASEALHIENQHAKKRAQAGDRGRGGGGESGGGSSNRSNRGSSSAVSGFDSFASSACEGAGGGGGGVNKSDFIAHSVATERESKGGKRSDLKRGSAVKHNHRFEV